MLLCSISGCKSPVYRKNLYAAHYGRLKRHGNPLGGRQRNGASLQWLIDHVNYGGTDCLIWPFARGNAGRGSVKLNGRQEGAHRAMCRLAHGEPDCETLEAAHSCGHGHLGCVNPRHLRWATHKENAQDRIVHGTVLRGDKVSGSKLTESDIIQIWKMSGCGVSQIQIAQRFQIHRSMVSKILNRKSWAWLNPGETQK